MSTRQIRVPGSKRKTGLRSPISSRFPSANGSANDPQLCESFADPFALGNLLEIGERNPVFRFDPGTRIWRVDIFEPAVGIGDFCAVIVVDHVALAGGWIGNGLYEHERR